MEIMEQHIWTVLLKEVVIYVGVPLKEASGNYYLSGVGSNIEFFVHRSRQIAVKLPLPKIEVIYPPVVETHVHP